MKLFFHLLIVTVMASALSFAGDKVFPYKYETFTLENGLKVYLVPMEAPGLVAYYSVVRTGSRDEWEPGKSGFAHFFEHMMFRGTSRFPGSMYDSIITSIGADANAYTDDDLTVYHLNFAADDLETVMDLESDRFRNLKYSLQQFQTESGAVYGEYRKGRTSPWSVAVEELRDMAFTLHTYKHTTIGFEADIKEMPNQYEYSISFYNRYYRPENVVLVIVGDINAKRVRELVRKYYDPWKPGYIAPQITPEPQQAEPRFKEVQYEGKTLPLMIMGYKVDAFDPANINFVARIPFAELAFGETSDIYKKLVLDEQKVQFIQANPALTRDPYMFEIYTMVKNPDDIDYVRKEIEGVLQKYKSELVDESKLASLKKRNKYQFLMGLDNPGSVAAILPQFITLSGGIEVIDGLYNAVDRVKPEEIRQMVNTYFLPERANTVILKGAN